MALHDYAMRSSHLSSACCNFRDLEKALIGKLKFLTVVGGSKYLPYRILFNIFVEFGHLSRRHTGNEDQIIEHIEQEMSPKK